MEANNESPYHLLSDDRSDSGVSSLRSVSGDERSGSRSSALSSTDDSQLVANRSNRSPFNRSPLFVQDYNRSVRSPLTRFYQDAARVWRDPNLSEQADTQIRHVNSVQHQSLLMSSHQTTPASSSGPPTTSSVPSTSLYAPPSLISPHPRTLHSHLGPNMYAPGHHIPEMLWKSPYNLQGGIPSSHLLAASQAGHHTEEIMERERLMQERHNERMASSIRERQMEAREMEKLKEREKERAEREKQEKMEREREEKERQEQALQNHFEKSLRQAQQKSQWNPITGRPSQQQRNSSAEEEKKRVEQEMRDQRLMASRPDPKDNRFYANVQQRVPSMTSKVDYPPPAHSSRVGSMKQPDKMANLHQVNQKNDMTMFSYSPYHSQAGFAFAHDAKTKDLHKASGNVGLLAKSASPIERDLPNPPPLISEMKNSVIVKHDGKNPHHMEPRVSIAHSPSPKLRTEMMGHYMPLPQTSKGNMYEYRSPSQSPHHLAHSSPHHLEAQSMGKATHHRQISSPHHQRQSPHQHSSPEMRYRGNSEGQTIIYPAPGKTNYQFLATTAGYSHHTTNVSNSKPKVSSPAPHHIYGKPSAGILSGMPPSSRGVEQNTSTLQIMNSKPPLPLSISPSPFQQASQYHPPPPQVSTQLHCPPPAHRTVPYDRIYQGTTIPSGIPSKPTLHGTSPPTASAAPSGIPRSHPQYIPTVSLPSGLPVSPSMQMQPLDLGMSSASKQESSSPSPKRKGTPVHMLDRSDSPVEAKRRKLLEPPTVSSPQVMYSVMGGQQPQLTRVNEPTPLIASEATTITTLVNAGASFEATTSSPSGVTLTTNPSVLTENLPDLSVTPVSVEVCARPSSADLSQQTASVTCGGGDSPAPGAASIPSTSTSGKESPTTSIKTTITPNSIDSEKSNSPGPNKSNNSSSYPVRHLKKAWLQRHTGEDMEDTTGIVGSGSCVTLPINITSTNNPTTNNNKDVSAPPVSTLHAIGSMAVNSISKTKHLTNKSNNRKGVLKEGALNGHPGDLTKADDSSSSDQERGRKSPPKRKPPKVKRKKGGGVHKKPVEEKKRKTNTPTVASESGSDSEKDTASEKDSDSGASTTISVKKGSTSKEPRKRGRRPKISKNNKSEEPRAKKPKEEILPQRDPFRKPPVGQLKKTGESFLQDGPCFEVAPKLAKCRECRWTPNQRSKNMPNIFCRFYAFRRLRYTKNGQLAIAGFSDPHKNSLEDDIKLWLPNPENPPSDLDLETSKFLLKQVGDHFCDLLVQEKNAVNEHLSDDKTVAWKRVVQGVREMCDVCETTLFNFHWACGKCGFVVCLDCYKGRKNGTLKIWGETGKDRDEYSWLLCTNRQAHEQEKLMLTQIIADNCLMRLGKMVHEVRELWNIEQFCDCPMSKDVKSNNLRSKDIIKNIINENMNGNVKKEEDTDVKPSIKTEPSDETEDTNPSPLSWIGDMLRSREKDDQERNVKKEKQEDIKVKNEDASSEDDDNNFSTLRELLIRPSHKQNGSRAGSPTVQSKGKKTNVKLDNLDEVLTSVIEENSMKADEVAVVEEDKCELKHFVRRRRYNWQVKGRVCLPIRIMTMTESKILYPNVPHSWLCDGKLLRLIDPLHKENYKIFQDQWKRGQPVIVSDVDQLLNKDLWNPDSFARDFGEDKNDLINCMTGNLVPNQPMKKFWEGFDHFEKRLKDDRGNPMLLKLKDWPPGEDFAEMLPTRFQDLMDVLPLAEYTHRNGRLNLASRLPDCFVRPDLGPKMYNAYGSALHPSKGTTNLHLDISDAVNVMVYVGIPKDGDSDEHIKEAFRAIDEAGCDILTRRRVRDKGELPGALWHIYNAKDADKIRDLLNKVVMEKGGRLEPNHDPIHDQSCYLDGPLRERLYKEYGVEGYAIVQCLGDAVFIPAGAPHQVRNLHNCIKVAEDFVSPENVSHCFHLTQEFRDLSDTHSNHEDKLQIKNIIYHAVKDSLSTLNSILNQHVVKFDSENSESNGNSGAEGQKKDSPTAEIGGADV